jgi:hypothetical protein
VNRGSALAHALGALAAFAAACRGSSGKVHRSGSAAPVEVVQQPTGRDAGAGGATVEEVEPNDADDVATPMPLGGKARGKIDPDGDVDHFRLEIPKPGVLSVMLAPVDVDLVLDLEDAAGNVVARSARGGVRLAEGMPNLAVTPGRYTVVVRAAPRKKPPAPRRPKKGPPSPEAPRPPAPVYELSAQLVTPPAGAETEPDDDRGTANDVLTKDTVTGFIGWQNDQDVWKLSTEALSAKNALDISVGPVEGVAVELEVEDALGQALLVHKGARGDGVSVHNLVPSIAPGAPPFVYIVVRADKSNPETPYQLHTEAWVPNIDDETEPNDTPEHAYPIAPDRTVVHAWWEYGDVDCFAIPVAAQPRAIEITVDTPAELDLAAELLVDGKSAAKVDHPGKGAAEKLGAQVGPGAHAVACVRAAREGPGRAKIPYDLHVQESAATGDNAP